MRKRLQASPRRVGFASVRSTLAGVAETGVGLNTKMSVTPSHLTVFIDIQGEVYPLSASLSEEDK